MPATAYGKTLGGLSLNLIVRDVAKSLPFYTEVLGLRALYSDPDFAAFEGPAGARLQLHADHTYESMPWAADLAGRARRGLGAEIRLLGIDPDDAERRARERGFHVLLATGDREGHGWRDCILEDADGYTFAVGVTLAR